MHAYLIPPCHIYSSSSPSPSLLTGIYICSKCGYELFSSQSKFLHSSPWPAFTHPIHSDSVSKYLERPGAFKGIFLHNGMRSHVASVGMAWAMNSSTMAPKRASLVSEYLAVLSLLFIKLNLGRTWTNKQDDNILANSTREPLVLDGKLPLQRDETNSLDFSSSTIQCAPSAGKPHPRIPPGVPYARIFSSDSNVN
ncbi:Methionine-R-sulfoxide reductase B1, partial [Ophiophagus hannah]